MPMLGEVGREGIKEGKGAGGERRQQRADRPGPHSRTKAAASLRTPAWLHTGSVPHTSHGNNSLTSEQMLL